MNGGRRGSRAGGRRERKARGDKVLEGRKEERWSREGRELA